MADNTQLKSLQEKIEIVESELLFLKANSSKNRLELNHKITHMQQKIDENTQLLHKIIGILTFPQSNRTLNIKTETTNRIGLFQQQKALVKNNNPKDVSLWLASHVLQTEGRKENFVFSPLSIQILLSAVAVGSKGSTRDQLVSFLGAESFDHLIQWSFEVISNVFDGDDTTLSFANGVFVDRRFGLKQSFKRVLDSPFKAETSQLDFSFRADEATNEINEWVEKKTNGLIKDLIPLGSITDLTILVLANALYFKGDWIEKFDSSSTKEEEFYLLNGSTIRVPFMRSSNEKFVAAIDDFKVLQLPYKLGLNYKRNFSMYIFLPNAKDGLAVLVNKMSTEPRLLDRCLPQLQSVVGSLAIPKFKISFAFEASKALKELGLSSVFDGEGDLSEMVEYSFVSQKLIVSKIHQKSFVDVNEEGTEAAAGSVTLAFRSTTRTVKKIDFVANHPFMFLIREETSGAVLFIGQVLQPQQS